VITNAHVIRGSRVSVETWDGRELAASVAALDARRDLAHIKVGTLLDAPSYRDSSDVTAGELAIAVGNPMGFTGAVSTGVVHGVGPLPGFGRRPWVQADLRLAPGNSGGPLADARGRVIGINTMVANGLGLAVPSALAAAFMAAGASPPRLGVTVRPVAVRDARGIAAGLLVLDVERGSPAEGASLMPGDILIGAGGRSFETMDDLPEAIEQANGVLGLRFLRGVRAGVRETVARLDARAEAA
jgi:serine protease Do